MEEMTLNKCIDSWISQYDEFAEHLEQILQIHSNFKDVAEALIEKYAYAEITKSKKSVHIPLLRNGYKMIVTVRVGSDKNIILSDKAEFWIRVNYSFNYRISDMRKIENRYGLESQFGIYFYEHWESYMIQIHDLTEGDSCYTIYYRKDKDAAFKLARKYQKELSTFSQCFCIVVYKCEMGQPILNSRYTFSSKTKKETKFQMRKNLRFDFDVDEHFSKKPNKCDGNINSEEDEVSVVMSVAVLDEHGNLDTKMQQFESKDKARMAANEIIDQWMNKNHYTLYEDEFNEYRDTYQLCEKRDFDTSIKVNCVCSIAEINILIMQIEF